MCLLTKPPAVRSGYVHLVSLHTGHLYAFVPTAMREEAKYEPTTNIYCITQQFFNQSSL